MSTGDFSGLTEDGLKHLIDMMRASQSATSNQSQILQEFTKLSQYPDYPKYLLYIFTEMTQPQYADVRPVAGILLKKCVKDVNETHLGLIRNYVLKCMADPFVLIRKTTASITTTIVARSGFVQWPALLPFLAQHLESNEQNVVVGAFQIFNLLCEDHSDLMDADLGGSIGRPLNVLIPLFIKHFTHPLEEVRKLAIQCVGQFLYIFPSALNMNMANYIAGLFHLATDPSVIVKKEVCKALTSITEVKIEYIEGQMPQVVKYFLAMTQDPEETLALSACEFWTAISTTNMCAEAVGPVLSELVPVLLNQMVYQDDDMALLAADDDETVPDEPKDIKPFVYMPKSKGEEEEDDTDEASEWGLRKSAASGLDNLSVIFEDSLLPILLPVIEQRLKSQDWKIRESAILTLGAISEGCGVGMKQHLNGIIPYLLELLKDPKPLVRSITCWSLSRYVYYVLKNQEVLSHMVNGMLHSMMDRNKKVQEAAVSALANICDQARELMIPFLPSCVQCIVIAFGRYQAKNTFLLLDFLGSLAEAVGTELNQTNYINHILPPVIARWNALSDDDPQLLSLLNCVGYLAISMSIGFQPYAVPVYQRCCKIIEMVLNNNMHDGFLTACLDLIAGLVEGLGSGIESLITNSNLLPLSIRCLADRRPSVEQSVLALLGDMSRCCPSCITPHLQHIMPLIIGHVSLDFISVCNNASWAIGELCIRISPQELDPYTPAIMQKLIGLLCKERLNTQLRDNVAITLGRMGTANGQRIAPSLPEFIEPWVKAIRAMRKSDRSRESAIRGLFTLLAINPGAAMSCMPYIMSIAASWETTQTPTDITNTIGQVLHVFKAGAPAAYWTELKGATAPQEWDILQKNYNI